MLGALCRGEKLDTRKAKLFLLIIIGFIFGGTAGAILFGMFQFFSLIAPAGVCLVIAMIYNVYLRKAV